MQTLNFLLMGPSQGGSSSYTQLIMFGLIFVVFYFFMIRPQMKKAKDEKNFKEGVKKGDRIITIGGIHGKNLKTLLEKKQLNCQIVEFKGYSYDEEELIRKLKSYFN